jgi:hypothetical protein
MYQYPAAWKPISKVYDFGKDYYYLGIPKEYVELRCGIKVPYYGHYWSTTVERGFS